MGLEASLKLLELPPESTIDDANQAYADLHRKIDLFYRESGNPKDRQEDIELLTCAYETAVVYLSDENPDRSTDFSKRSCAPCPVPPPKASAASEMANLHFTINFPADEQKDDAPPKNPSAQTVEEAISITSQRIHEAESAIPVAQRSVESAAADVESACQRHEAAKRASLNAIVSVKAAKTRSLLLEMEAKRAKEEAVVIAEKAKKKADAAEQAARKAHELVDKARQDAIGKKRSEETAAAEAVCAEDRLEKEKARYQSMVHSLLEARDRMRMFRNTTAAIEHLATPSTTSESNTDADGDPTLHFDSESEASARDRVASELKPFETALGKGKKESGSDDPKRHSRVSAEKRKFPRIVYPPSQCPAFSIAGRSVSILDLSTTGMRLESEEGIDKGVVRGTIDFADQPPVKVTGKVIRIDDGGIGLRLVTRIGNQVLDRERLRLRA